MSQTLSPPEFQIGEIRVRRIMEMEFPFVTPFQAFPRDATEQAVAAHRPRLEPWALDPETGKMILAVQSYLLRTSRHTILVDTCVGCDKTNERFAFWHERSDRGWLDRLALAGVAPEAVDYVFCTHLHGDHCGWNTRLLDGRWVPTFPNARYVMAREEADYIQTARPDTFNESVSPVIEAGQALLVEDGYALDDEIHLERTPGHTPAHASVWLKSRGVEAALTGDVIHNPIQCAHPDWRFMSDADPELAVRTRRAVLEAQCETGRLMLTAHFPSPSVGHVIREGEVFGFRFREGS